MRTLDELGISPAPWKVLNWRMFPNKIGVAAEGGWVVADVQVAQYGCCSTLGDRNARLIAAAPMLYEALRGLIDACGEVGYKDGGTAACYESERHLYDAIWKAEAALAAASGESEPDARVWCKHDPTRKCVDCEGCQDESEVNHE